VTIPGQAALFGPQPLTHLRLQRQVSEGRRRPRPAGGGRQVKYPDQRAHGRDLSARALAMRAVHAERKPVLGVDPELVIVLRVTDPPKIESLRHAGLDVIDVLSDGRIVVSAERDTALESFRTMLDDYQSGPRSAADSGRDDGTIGLEADPEAAPGPSTPRTAPNQALFDCIVAMDAFGPDDVITEELAAHLAAAGDEDPIRVDAQLWCPEDEDDARTLAESVAKAIDESGGGIVLDRTVRHRAGLSLIRFEASARTVRLLASVRGVRQLDRLPRAALTYRASVGLDVTALTPVLPPEPDAPIVALIDSGISSGHPLVGPAVKDVMSLPPHVDGSDENGHGTAVASLILYGSLEPVLADSGPWQAAGRLVSIRVLDADARFADDDLWESQVLDALELAADSGARVVNLSLGDERRPYRPGRPTPLAAAVDEFVRRRGVVVLVSVGNYPLMFHPTVAASTDSWVRHQLDDPLAGVLDPATSALSLTVGALCADDEAGHRRPRERVESVPVGGQDWPSPITRLGPGAAGMIKPELSMPGGGAVLDTLTRRLTAGAGVVVAAGNRPDRLFQVDTGTSFAVPLATHCAVRVLAANPHLGAEAVRALLLASTYPDLAAAVVFTEGAGTAAHRNQRQRLSGYGRANADRAAFSGAHRAVLISEESLPLDHVHLYRVPVPTTFFDARGWRRLTVALAFSPVTRSTRIDYLGSRMSFEVYRGVSIDEVAAARLVDSAVDDATEVDPLSAPLDDQGAEAAEAAISGPRQLARHAVRFEPSSTRRSAARAPTRPAPRSSVDPSTLTRVSTSSSRCATPTAGRPTGRPSRTHSRSSSNGTETTGRCMSNSAWPWTRRSARRSARKSRSRARSSSAGK
jgi:hypothetical protein